MYDLLILVVDFIVKPGASLNLRSENSTTSLMTFDTNCLPVQSFLGFSIAGLTKKSLVLAGFPYNKEKVD
jgi:hypothetical protein